MVKLFLYNLLLRYQSKRNFERVTNDICKSVERYCSIKQLSSSQISRIQEYWSPLTGGNVDTRMHQMMLSLTGVFDTKFEPFDVCKKVQDKSMTKRAMQFFDDKNLYRSLLHGFNIPKRVAECCNGIYYLPELGGAEISKSEFLEALQNVEDCIIKPSIGTDGGRGVCSFDVNGGIEQHSNLSVEEFLKQYGINFCIERKVHESNNLQRLNPSSCNTLRIHTFRNRSEQRIYFISSYVRIGKFGQVVDNMLSGGVGARIVDMEGHLDNAVSCYPYKVFTETESGIYLKNYRIDYFDKMVETVIKAHSNFTMFDLMGWDVTVDNAGNVIIIEYNPNPDMRIEQAIFGTTCLLNNQEWIVKQSYGI